MQPKVLIAAPISKHKDYIIHEWIPYVVSMPYENKEILLVDNSADSDWHLGLIDTYGINILHVNPQGKSNVEYMCLSQNVIRQFVIQNNFEYLMSIECDVFPPHDIINYLMCYGVPIISVPYMVAQGEQSEICMSVIDGYIEDTNNRHVGTFEGYVRTNGQLAQVDSCGLGCTLIHRSIINRNPFRFMQGQATHSDTFFYIDCKNKGISVFLDTSIICRHENQSWKQFSEYNNISH